LKSAIPDQIFPDHQPGAMNARLDAFARQGEHARYLFDRQFFDIAQQDHLAIMIGQRLDGAGKIDANIFGREMRQTHFRIFSRSVRHSHRPAQQAKTRATRHRKQPRRKRRHRTQRAEAAVQQQQRFLNRVVDIGRAAIARGITADVGLGYCDQRGQRIGIAAARGLDQRGVATRCPGQRGHGEGSFRPTMAHIGQKPKKPVRIATAPVPAIK
jgi:hypothetical protein